MSVDALAALQKAISDVQIASESIKSACDVVRVQILKIPEPFKTQAVEEIRKKVGDWLTSDPIPSQPEKPQQVSTNSSNNVYAHLSSTEAIELLLKNHPKGLTTHEIINALAGKFATSSASPVRILTSTISALKSEGRIEQGDGKVLTLSERPTGSPHQRLLPYTDPEKKSHRQLVTEFFEKNQNEWVLVADLSAATGISEGSLRTHFANSPEGTYENRRLPNGKNEWRKRVQNQQPSAGEPLPQEGSQEG
ncbi:MAG: hypothetical protein ACRC8S_06755 [Fimbriiglobus sp.]